jgi:membrane fusion protein, hemolysin D
MNRTRDELEFLPAALEVLETPPRPLARGVALLIAAFFCTALGWSIFGRIDTVAVAQGQLITTERVKLIQPLDNAIVRAIHVHDGARVKAGDLLVELDPTEPQANVEALRTDLLKAQLDAAVAAALLEDAPATSFRTPAGASGLLVDAARSQMLGEAEKLKAALAAIDADIDELQGQVASFETQLKKAENIQPLIAERLDDLQILNDKQLARKPDILAARQQRIENQSEILTATSGIKQARARIESRLNKREEIKATARADILQRRGEALRRVASLEQQVRKEERRLGDRQLRAPLDGTVFGLAVFTVGGVVTTKDVLLRLVPEGSRLEVEAVILNRDIGFIEKGQPAEIKLETFPFTRFGLIDGDVKEVWRDAIQDDKLGLVYKAIVSLKQDRILVGSKWVDLAPGMSVQAEIKTGDRRVISYFLSPLLRYRDESLRER